MANYLICGNYGAANIGDEAILEGLIFELKKNDPDAAFTVMSGNPENTKLEHEVSAAAFFPSGIRSSFSLKSFKSALGAHKLSDIFVLGGGGLFSDQDGIKAIWIWFVQTFVAHMLNKKIVMMGQSVGPIKSPLAKYLTKTAFRWAKTISVRDLESAEVLQSLGITTEIKVIPDMATNLSAIYSSLIAEKNSLEIERNFYSVINLKYTERTNKLYEVEVVDFIKFLISQNGHHVYLKPFGSGKVPDEEYMYKLIDQYSLDKNMVRVHTDYSIEGTLKLLLNANLVLGMRLHSLILAEVCRTPFIGISYHEKVKNYFKNSEFILDADQVSVSKLTSLSKSLLSRALNSSSSK